MANENAGFEAARVAGPLSLRRRAVAVCMALLATGIATAQAEPAHANAAPTNGMIAFFSWGAAAEHISEPLDLMVVNPDGTGAQVVVPGAAERSQCGFDLAWSPDGNKIAWASGGSLNVVNADGTSPTRIASACASDVTWSPDGQWLALTIWGNGSRVGLVRPDGTGFRWLRSCTWGELEPAFSPDSATIAVLATGTCVESEPIGWGIYGFDVSTGDLKGLYFDTESRLPDDYSAKHLVWSRDGSQLLMGFADTHTGGECNPLGVDYGYATQDLWRAPAVFGTTLTPVASTMGEYDWQEFDGSWSPDGTQVAFGATRNLRCEAGVLVPSGKGELFRMTANGGDRTRIYSAPGAIKAVINTDWQPCTAATFTCTSVPVEATDDSTSTTPPRSITIDVTANDSLPAGAVTVRITTPASHGFAKVADGNRITYVPGAGSSLADRFDYEVCAGSQCATATIRIKIKPPSCRGQTATMWGTRRGDRLVGTPRSDVIAAFGGDDEVIARGGDDIVCAGSGDDLLDLGDGKDKGFGQAGSDRIVGGRGLDFGIGGPGKDTCHTERRHSCELPLLEANAGEVSTVAQ